MLSRSPARSIPADESLVAEAQDAAFEEATGGNQQRREAEEVSKSLKLKKGACEPARADLRRSRKERMRTVEHFLCDDCDVPITDPTAGFIIHGNIYVADPRCLGGLVGNNFPETDEPIPAESVTKTVLCRSCLMKALGLFDPPTKRRSKGISELAAERAVDRLMAQGGLDFANQSRHGGA